MMRLKIMLSEKLSRAKKINILYKKYKKSWRKYQEMANFKEPIIQLIKNNKVEFYEDATSGNFYFDHSDGSKRKVKLDPEFQLTFDYGKRNFKGYIVHENYPTPLPEKPIITAEQYQWGIDKTQQDQLNHQEKQIKARGDMWYKIFIGIAVIIVALALANMFGLDIIGSFFNRTPEQVTTVVANNTPITPATVSIK